MCVYMYMYMYIICMYMAASKFNGRGAWATVRTFKKRTGRLG